MIAIEKFEEMQLLLKHFNAYIYKCNDNSFTIVAHKKLPHGVLLFTKEFSESVSLETINIFGKTSVQDIVTGSTLNYTFYNSYATDVVDMLLKATENERFKEFSNILDIEITKELGASKV
jgi:hypothetical protein